MPEDQSKAAPTAPSIPLDEVMVAMDVVDTLRHEEEFVRQELSQDDRREALIRRVQDIYSDQGLEVPESVIRKGVVALEQDRFVYTPPKRTLSVRLAEAYTRRGFYAKWVLALCLLAGLIWAVYAIPRRLKFKELLQQDELIESSQVKEFESIEREYGFLLDRSPKARAIADDLRMIQNKLEDASFALVAAQATKKDDADLLLRRKDSFLRLGERLEDLRSDLGAAFELADIEARTERALAELEGLNLDDEAKEALQRARQRGFSIAERGDATPVEAHLQSQAQLVRRILESYTLRIVSGEGKQSGIFRVDDQNPNVKNFYILVEAIDDRGQPLKVAFIDEEIGESVEASTFGVRVPESVYESVKADKLDNGIVDQSTFAKKRRGALALDYFFEISGGRVSRLWK
jgi:hypothetical protein